MFTSADLKIDLKLNMYIYRFFFHFSVKLKTFFSRPATPGLSTVPQSAPERENIRSLTEEMTGKGSYVYIRPKN